LVLRVKFRYSKPKFPKRPGR